MRYDPRAKPGVSNLLEILAAVDRTASIDAVEAEFAGAGYGAFKGAVADAVVDARRAASRHATPSWRPTPPRSTVSSRRAPPAPR